MFSIEINTVILPPPEIEKMLSYAGLPNGWDCGSGFAPNILTIEKAIKLYEKFNNLGFSIDSTPMTNGGITLVFNIGEFFIDVIVNPNDTFDIREEHGIGIDYSITNQEINVPINRIREILNATIKKCSLLEPSISENTSPSKEDFKVTASVISEMAYQSSSEAGLYNTQVHSANIL